MTEFKKRDHVNITCEGRSVIGRVMMMSPNQRAGLLWWDAVKHEAMLAGHIGSMPIMQNDDGNGYHTLMSGVHVTIEPSEPVEDTFEEAMRYLPL